MLRYVVVGAFFFYKKINFFEKTIDKFASFDIIDSVPNELNIWGYSSAGRALEWHSRGQRFDPAYLHQNSLSRWPGQRLFYYRISIFCLILPLPQNEIETTLQPTSIIFTTHTKTAPYGLKTAWVLDFLMELLTGFEPATY